MEGGATTRGRPALRFGLLRGDRASTPGRCMRLHRECRERPTGGLQVAACGVRAGLLRAATRAIRRSASGATGRLALRRRGPANQGLAVLFRAWGTLMRVVIARLAPDGVR